ncbi:hypothetical protein EMIT0158MI4_150096 [Burkholderia ambifaria]
MVRPRPATQMARRQGSRHAARRPRGPNLVARGRPGLMPHRHRRGAVRPAPAVTPVAPHPLHPVLRCPA